MLRRWCGLIAIQLLATSWYCRADECPTEEPSPKAAAERDNLKALDAAIGRGDLTEVKRLFKVLDRSKIPTFQAWWCSNVDIIAFLHEQGKMRAHPVQIAAVLGDAEEVRALLKRHRKEPIVFPGTDVAPNNLADAYTGYSYMYTPLRLAIRRGHTDVVRVLIDNGADVNKPLWLFEPIRGTEFDAYPLGEAIQLGRADIVELLVNAGAILQDPPRNLFVYRAKKGSKVDLPKFYKTHAKSPRNLVREKLDKMYQAGLLVKEPNRNANLNCPLVIAIACGRARIVSILLDAGVNPNLFIGDRYSPLHRAVRKGHPGIVRALIEKGANVNARDPDGSTPLTCAVVYGHGDVEDILRAAGAKK